jgi:glycerol-3-phosphate dehydrogenase
VAVAGGKLTTFRAIALDALRSARPAAGLARRAASPAACSRRRRLPPRSLRVDRQPAAAPARPPRRAAGALLAAAREGELDTHPRHRNPWAELRWAARAEAVQRLDDLLLRRTRLGLQLRRRRRGSDAAHPRDLPAGARLDDARWEREEAGLRGLWRDHYGLPQAEETV